MSGAEDLSGRWTGIFSYPRDLPATGFEAMLTETAGTLTGHVVEPRHDAARVRFAKSYDDTDYDLVRYEGQVDPEGTEITGRWDIPGIWSGTFIMIREGGVAEEVAVQASETADR